ncbi:hypothetical protein TWF694_005267 [Orbilia ellipsospora]|uniref:Uncharacterized protein n=1 Tax=Orbilia ellipsospora TaxID=2528407 RepID=A0AAV9WTU6_9PEZI
MVFKLKTTFLYSCVLINSFVSAKFLIGVYNLAKLDALEPGQFATPSWILCHPRSSKRWGLYAADITSRCDYPTDGENADKWRFKIPGDRNLDIGETISQFYLTGSDASLYKGEDDTPAITYDSNFKNTYFSYGYTEGSFRDAPFKLIRDGKVSALSDSNGAKNGDVLDFVGISGTHIKDRTLRLQRVSGEGGFWHIARGSALPVSDSVPEVEFQVIFDLKKAIVSTSGRVPLQDGTKAGHGYIEEDDYKLYEKMLPKQWKMGTMKGLGRGLFSKLGKSLNNVGDRVASGFKGLIGAAAGEKVEEEVVEQIPIGRHLPLGMKIVARILLLPSALGIIISVIPKGPGSAGIPNQRLCMPLRTRYHVEQIETGLDPGLFTIDPRDRGCGAQNEPGWHWDIGPSRKTPLGHTLIQLTGGPNTLREAGITHSLDPAEQLHFGILSPGRILRSEFRVKRNGVYQDFDNNSLLNATLKVGDYLEFWGPSHPEDRQLYLRSLFHATLDRGIWVVVREKAEGEIIMDYGLVPPVELRVVDLGFNEIADRYSMEDDDDLKDDVRYIDEITETRKKSEQKSDFCGLSKLCKATAKGIGRFFGGKPREIPRIDLQSMGSDGSPDQGDFSSRRNLRLESQENSLAFSPRDSDQGFGNDLMGIFEPRTRLKSQRRPQSVPKSKSGPQVRTGPGRSIFKPRRLMAKEVEDILQRITEKEEEATVNTGVDETIPDERPAVVAESDFGNLPTAQFRTEQVDQEEPSEFGYEGQDEEELEKVEEVEQTEEPSVISHIEEADIKLDQSAALRRRISDRRWQTYARCIQSLLRKENGEPDEEIQWLIDKGWGMYMPLDFDVAIATKRPSPPCPGNRQDIINMAIDQGHPRYVPPGATGANPQSGVGWE